ncbi:transglutaminase family protein [Desulfurispirillum indicum]|uniref:Transglutaminase domain-containing protein n=1 Tax=Desulfurispirillum indicum (strain ATCC BAA-1389 / DSM 22839 / S5) TaxID=653733 RepID=E6W065_DESIS|nr:transglutaminase family protein [Desulfurispirillum indicum]ADU65191.1 transglutaminase domain-containing protein [Desulfurispirillum indicum S5]UCZ57081.1 transglutaminase family protein [Desulfurispirillum indicum]
MMFRVTHTTTYSYSDSVDLCYNETRIKPRSFSRQVVQSSSMNITPSADDYRERTDFFGNYVSYFCMQKPYREMIIKVISDVKILGNQGRDPLQQPISWEETLKTLSSCLDEPTINARQYTMASPLVPVFPELREYVSQYLEPEKPLVLVARDLMAGIFHDFRYVPGFTTITTSLTEVMRHRQGVCQDFAHVAIGCLRSIGLAAGYMSGYLETLPPPGQEKLVGADASHAWFTVYVPGWGWVHFDPTNNQLPDQQHIVCAWGRDYSDIIPINGVVYSSGKDELEVSVDVSRIG